MKKLLLSISILLIVSTRGYTQEVKLDKVIEETSHKISLNVDKATKKKSNKIISIRAYRKSLHIKIRTKKFC